ncbi:hypothetical protein L6259_01910 [Candidatus Parcubacteria bacterium]|nr:hypothetical protein [Patescibacteria group bacterium]MCG2694010.1 hypothetical protein [Candidatus Parcubacteria bacterium]
MENKDIRKIVKNGRGTYYISVPKEIMRELKWKERQKVIVKKYGSKVMITDWKK